MDRRSVTDKVGDSIVDRLGFSFDLMEARIDVGAVGRVLRRQDSRQRAGTVRAVCRHWDCVYSGSACHEHVLHDRDLHRRLLSLPAIAWAAPRMSAEAVKRSLPEAAALIAAEMSAGSSAETAVSRASVLPGPLGNLMRHVVQNAQQAGRLIFSHDLVEGALVEEFVRFKMPELGAFTRQIDLVASRGADRPETDGRSGARSSAANIVPISPRPPRISAINCFSRSRYIYSCHSCWRSSFRSWPASLHPL